MAFLERHLFVVLVWIATGVSFVAHLAGGAQRWLLAVGCIATLAVWLHVGHRVQRWAERVPAVPQFVLATLGLYVLFAALAALDASYLFMLFGVFSFTFGFVDNVRLAALLTAILTVIWIGAWLFHGLPAGAIATPIFVWGVANAINVLSTKISRQNDERGELIDRLHATQVELAVAERERGVLAERSRVAREIHDTLAQGFTSIVLVSEATSAQAEHLPPEQLERSLDLIATTARDNLNEARRLIEAQPPAALERHSLAEALENLGDDLRRRTSVAVRVTATRDVALGGSEEVVLYRVAQEACSNVEKHADAERVDIDLSLSGGCAVLQVNDDGVGFDPSVCGTTPVSGATDASGLSGGRGLGFMAERLAEFGGAVQIDAAPGRGTTVRAELPLSEMPIRADDGTER